MNHYCTYFDRGFLIQGVTLWRSLAARDPEAVLWVLALDDEVARVLQALGDERVRVVPLDEFEHADPEPAKAKAGRSRVEYFFTLSPCWPRWLLLSHPDIDRVTYLDADLFFFGNPEPMFWDMDAAGASVLITAHRFPEALKHYEQHGRFNVGVLSFRNDAVGRGCLEDWRRRCLEWCFDRVEENRYADQKYLDAWPTRLGNSLLVLEHFGVNLAPWNWAQHQLDVRERVLIDGDPLLVFHFARFRPHGSDRWWTSGQLDYGIMPQEWRDAIYTPYWKALAETRLLLRRVSAEVDFPQRGARLGREFWRALPLRAVFGGDWLRVGDRFYNLRFGLGRYSGRTLAALRRLVKG